MPCICIEWVPVQLYGLGLLGFDHLQLVYRPDTALLSRQDDWFVMEGVREVDRNGAFLGIEGADGRTTLSVANFAAREELIAKIGTPERRGSRCLAYEGAEFGAWETMASYARDIETQDFPYIAYGLPGSPTPTINSSSAIASLIYYSGLDPSQALPYGVHLSPGTATLLGTSGNDALRIEAGFSTLLGGEGRDTLIGGSDPGRIEKFYGGTGDDLFRWSSGFNILHGGQPGLAYAADGADVVDYSGAGKVSISFNRYSIPHKLPNYVAAFAGGLDHLYSIERIQWNGTRDRIVLGKGVELVEDDAVLEPSAFRGEDAGAHMRSGRLVSSEAPHRLLGDSADNVLCGGGADDVLYGGAGDDTLTGAPGSDAYVYLPGDGDDTIIDDGEDGGVDELVLAGGIAPKDVTVHRPAQSPDDLVLALAQGGRILLKGFFASPTAGVARVVFDRAPAWTRADLERFAHTA